VTAEPAADTKPAWSSCSVARPERWFGRLTPRRIWLRLETDAPVCPDKTLGGFVLAELLGGEGGGRSTRGAGVRGGLCRRLRGCTRWTSSSASKDSLCKMAEFSLSTL